MVGSCQRTISPRRRPTIDRSIPVRPSASNAVLAIGRSVGFGRRSFYVVRSAMDLHVKFDGHEIIVTRPGTDFILAYRKRPDSPNFVLTRSWEKPTVTSPEISEFRAHAFQAAVAKPRELGWL